MSERQAPLTPPDCDLQDFPRMMIDIPRLFASEFDAKANDTEWRLGVTLWLKSFHQVPAASLPDDDGQLAKLCGLGRDVKTWRKNRDGALRGWVKARDGLLYHPVVAEIALEAWLEKLTQRLSSGAGNAARWGGEFDPEPVKAEIATAAALLADINPKSKALAKSQVAQSLRKSRRDTHPEVPPKVRTKVPSKVPSGSQGKGREGNIDSDPDGSGAKAPPEGRSDPLTELRALDQKTAAWRLTLKVLMDRGGYSESRARPVVGKWNKAHTAEHLWQAAEAAWDAGTLDPVSYITATLDRLAAEDEDPLRNPSETRQRLWMDDWRSSPEGWREHERGPRPGEPGCRVSDAILREFGVEPAAVSA